MWYIMFFFVVVFYFSALFPLNLSLNSGLGHWSLNLSKQWELDILLTLSEFPASVPSSAFIKTFLLAGLAPAAEFGVQSTSYSWPSSLFCCFLLNIIEHAQCTIPEILVFVEHGIKDRYPSHHVWYYMIYVSLQIPFLSP